ncbi:MerR family transcriptional regulator [Clostridium carboxidivorans P7]|uniref:Transcriptional regulator, MerR family n=1 Tax=Clostridium carboxidivorans P7 TaxID=536227 RepID=C6Q1C5_9CLOT|nr:MerR family transcriptional regulator [Clostridium carboxidivorans]AKN31525.1 MerR family transcriptional regulator [Clostridium carboxidivorans P7]EET84707.1 transcriptional regulator, MerR family [Clostridium carboxidivorans P7]EFG87071.1 transcriptional regulator, MerR family [Clostridium carboxidivorans P7]
MDKSKKLYQIGEVSKICNIPIKTLRYYDEIKLLIPRKIDPDSNYRYYSNDQLALVLVIKHFKKAGFSLKEIKVLLGREDLEYNTRKINEKCIEIDNKINDLKMLKTKLQFFIKESKRQKKEHEEFKIEIKEIPVSYVAYIRSKGPCTIEEFAVRYCKLISLVERNNFHIIKNAMAVYYDNCIDFEEKEKEDYDIEVCIVISEEREIDGLVRKFGGFKAVTAVHYGSYDNMIDSYRKLYKYIYENGYEICGEPIDNYLVDIMNTVDEENYVTELIIPIR